MLCDVLVYPSLFISGHPKKKNKRKESKSYKKAEKSGAFAEIKVGLQQVFKDSVFHHIHAFINYDLFLQPRITHIAWCCHPMLCHKGSMNKMKQSTFTQVAPSSQRTSEGSFSLSNQVGGGFSPPWLGATSGKVADPKTCAIILMLLFKILNLSFTASQFYYLHAAESVLPSRQKLHGEGHLLWFLKCI